LQATSAVLRVTDRAGVHPRQQPKSAQTDFGLQPHVDPVYQFLW